MKFKTKEELERSKFTFDKIHQMFYGTGLDDAFKSFAERVDFYKKYEDSETAFELDCPDAYEEYLKTDRHHHYVIEKEFRNWLFNYCFGDVIE